MCPEETSELIYRPEESLEGSPLVEGECVENSSTESGDSPTLICEEMGQWRVKQPCLCNPGYELDSSMDMCSGMARGYSYLRSMGYNTSTCIQDASIPPECPEGTFSSGVGNGPCQTCPANRQWTGTGLSLCPCLQNYYRTHYEDPSTPCTSEYCGKNAVKKFKL